jgi:EAL domain-containing protein (putative c-di-GMP-specific phosphodiesterase class I)
VRLGGDEFACVLRNADGDAALERARLITAALDEEVRVDRHTFLLRACIGVTSARADSTPDQLLTEADLALHESKSDGAGAVTTFTPALRAAAAERRQLEYDLRRGIAAGELEAHYQPLMSLATGRLYGFEALVRWRHPERGLVPPGVFLPTAETTGLIGDLGREVLRQACAQARRMDMLTGTGSRLVMSVNLSGAQIADVTLARQVAAEIDRSGVDPSRLWLEVTETVAMEDVSQTRARLEELRALGVGLALDDFGTGYSSLSYIKEFPFTVLKIARELIGGASSLADTTILEAIVLLGERFGMTTVAEGIEDDEQANRVRALGCTVGQGFLWNRALTPDAAELLVSQNGSASIAA